ncbi:hypothetical protein Glove_242g157 [Diversispora epigaea]|uniref:Uncharacterized protein n=1 Tax=Diversispora epigaea TaxID=1348612 RepID=A0A397IHP6_9GLOM|nr:hypothetical protein Glove_242g157 [Diversispora epigaea]
MKFRSKKDWQQSTIIPSIGLIGMENIHFSLKKKAEPLPAELHSRYGSPTQSEDALSHTYEKLHKKIHCLINDCHHKLANWLWQIYHVSLLPEFKTRNGYAWKSEDPFQDCMDEFNMVTSHFQFRQYLLHKVHVHLW